MNIKNNDAGERFTEPENIMSLRKDQAYARRNGNEPERKLPPPPVLPPTGKLEKISGRLESFSSEYYREYFDVKAYRTNPLPTVSEAQRGVGAALATVAGSPATGILLASDEIQLSELDWGEYVQGSINGKPFRGWVGITRLQPGDEVEIVANWQDDHYEVYAIAMPSERIVSICPGCVRGRTAEAWIRLRNMFMLTFFLVFIAILGLTVHNDGSLAERLGIVLSSHYIPLWIMFFFIGIFFFGLMAISAYKAYANTTCLLSEEIFLVLGMKDVEKINLNKTTKKRERELKRKGLWYSPKDKTKPACPTQKNFGGFESWYYY